jgi:hypothetical protein
MMRYTKPQILQVFNPSSEIQGDPTQKQPGLQDNAQTESPVIAYPADE